MKRHPFNANEVDEHRLIDLTKKLGLSITAVIREAVRLLHKKEIQNVSKSLLVVALCTLSAACGGQINRLPLDTPPPRNTPTPVPTPTPAPITADSVLNMGMIGQTWLFQNGYGDITTFTIEAPEALTRTNPDGSETQVTLTDPSVIAGRGGNNLVMHMTKTARCSYWMLCVPKAEIWFVLHQNTDGSWRSTASVINLPQGCPWCGAGGQPTTDLVLLTSDVLDNQPGMALPYMIAPPNTSTGNHFIYETRVGATGNFGELTFDNRIPASSPLVGPVDGEYFRTDFYLEMVSTPAYTGMTIVSDQFEGDCGHEKWYFAPGKGIVKIISLYDGGETKNNPICATYAGVETHDPNLTIVRIN